MRPIETPVPVALKMSEPDNVFRTTRWSLVERAAGGAAGGPGATQRGAALGQLLHRYLPAMRSHLVGRMRLDPERADDLLQAFIVRKILEYDLLARADRTRGKFRTLLLTSLDNFVRNELARRSEHGEELTEHFSADPAEQPDTEFDLKWARALLEQAMERMRAECVASGREDLWHLFDARVLAPTLRDEPPMDYGRLVQRFGFRSPAHASNVLVTAKRTFERVLRAVVAEYADNAEEIDEEINSLRAVLARASG